MVLGSSPSSSPRAMAQALAQDATLDSASTYQPADPIISSNFSPFASSVSRARRPPTIEERARSLLNMTSSVSEREPLLGEGSSKAKRKPFYRPRPMWLVPFGFVASVVRGMTLAPRVQVYTQLSCNAVYGHDEYNHTAADPLPSTFSSTPAHSPHMLPFYYSLDPAGPHLDPRSFNISVAPATSFGRSQHARSSDMYITFADQESNSSGADDDEDEPDPRAAPSQRCLDNPDVQAGAARIQMIMNIVMGTLSALTTGWWGHFGEQHGRMRVLAASTLGLFLTDLTFILVSTPHSAFAAHGHKLLIVAPIIEGLLGGWSTLQGATSAYISDCTSDGSRSQIFSRFTGVFYVGFSLGPMIGAYLIRHPLVSFPGSPSSSSGHSPSIHNGQPTVTSVFYVAAMCSFVNLLLVLFLFPESIDKKRAKAAQNTSASTSELHQNEAGSQTWLQRCLSPLSLFIPKKIPLPQGGYTKDWSLTILGITLFLFLLATGIFQIKYLYAGKIYGWGAEQLSYYISFVGAVRAIHLLFIMPHLIAAFKPKPKSGKSKAVSHSVSASASLSVMTAASRSAAPAPPTKKPKPTLAHLAREMNFDLLLLRTSFFVECLSHSLVSFSPASLGEGFFVAFTTMSCFGAGVIPAVNSLALCIMQMQAQASGSAGISDDDGGAGRLFGALAALQAVGQMILGPLVFGLVFVSTVATFPKAIFVTAAGITFTAVVLLCLLRPDIALRLRQRRRRRRDEELERGRSRVSKDLSKNVSPILVPQASTSTTHRYMH